MVKVEVATSSVTQDEPVRLTIESDAPIGTAPDLTPLEQDFSILQRNVSHSTHSFNGQTQQRTVLHLTLLPRHGGDLTIPALHIGEETSRPVQVQVSPGTDTTATMPSSPPAQPYSPTNTPPTGMDWMGSPGMGDWGTPMWGGNPAGGVPGWGPPPDSQSWTPPPAETVATAPEESPAPTGPGFWPWLTGFAFTGWLLTALALWRQRKPRWQRTSTPTTAPAAPSVPPPSPTLSLEEAIAGVKLAYQASDPFAARDALLLWASRVWFEDAPTNLSRLAARCPTQLQRHILRLEQALYSPTPIPWNEQPVWALLEGLSDAGSVSNC
jgi:hypothetical protein